MHRSAVIESKCERRDTDEQMNVSCHVLWSALWPVLPPTFMLMGKAANRGVLSELDPSLEQILQELINLLPVSARVPSEVDVELQKKVATRASSFRKSNKVAISLLEPLPTSAVALHRDCRHRDCCRHCYCISDDNCRDYVLALGTGGAHRRGRP